MTGAIALTGGPRRPGEGLLQRLERLMREDPRFDPRGKNGVLFYGIIGVAIGFFIGVH